MRFAAWVLGAAMTANVITYRGRSAAREVGKVLQLAETEIDRLARMMHQFEWVDPANPTNSRTLTARQAFDAAGRLALSDILSSAGLASEARWKMLKRRPCWARASPSIRMSSAPQVTGVFIAPAT